MRHGADLGLLDFFFLCLVWLSASEPASNNDSTAAAAATLFQAAARLRTATLALACGTGVGILSEGVGIAFRKNFHHPAIKVIDWMVHDGLETPVVLSMSFFNVVTKADAKI